MARQRDREGQSDINWMSCGSNGQDSFCFSQNNDVFNQRSRRGVSQDFVQEELRQDIVPQNNTIQVFSLFLSLLTGCEMGIMYVPKGIMKLKKY